MIELFNKGAEFAESAFDKSICDGFFSLDDQAEIIGDEHFAKYVSDLFSDIWQGFSDEVYFDEPFNFTEKRFKKSGVDPHEFSKIKLFSMLDVVAENFQQDLLNSEQRELLALTLESTD